MAAQRELAHGDADGRAQVHLDAILHLPAHIFKQCINPLPGLIFGLHQSPAATHAGVRLGEPMVDSSEKTQDRQRIEPILFHIRPLHLLNPLMALACFQQSHGSTYMLLLAHSTTPMPVRQERFVLAGIIPNCVTAQPGNHRTRINPDATDMHRYILRNPRESVPSVGIRVPFSLL